MTNKVFKTFQSQILVNQSQEQDQNQGNDLAFLMKNYFSKMLNDGFEYVFNSGDFNKHNFDLNLKTILPSLILFNENDENKSFKAFQVQSQTQDENLNSFSHEDFISLKFLWKDFLNKKIDYLSKNLSLTLSLSFEKKVIFKENSQGCEKAEIVLNLHGKDVLIASFNVEIIWQHEYYEVENMGEPQLETSIYFSEEIPKAFIK